MNPENPLGRVVATELKPSTPHQFHFWTARESPIGIGAIVRVEDGGRVVFGVVTDALRLFRSGDADARRHRSRRRSGRRRRRADCSGGDPTLHRRSAAPDPGGAAPAGATRAGLARVGRGRGPGAPDGRVHRWRAVRPESRWDSMPPVASSPRSISTAISCSVRKPPTSTSPASPVSPPRPVRSSSCSAASSRPFPVTKAVSGRSAST